MKKLLFFLGLAVFFGSISACTTMKRDCQGVRHTKLKNGIYI